MDAITLLNQQHDEVEALFEDALKESQPTARQQLFEQIADSLAVHTAIEEKIFYRQLYDEETQDLLLEAAEEHLAAKRLIADLSALPPGDRRYVAKLTLLKEEVRHHVQEERKEVFPLARNLLDKDQLTALGQEMEAMALNLRAGARAPRLMVPLETAEAAELS